MKRFLGLVTFMAMMVMGVGLLSAEEAKPLKAVCELKATKGNKVEGKIIFIQRKNSVMVRAHVSGLTPGKHGFHIHECGDCSAPDGSSAKGHFNPGKHNHGGPSSHDRHAGDLGNLNANDKGVAEYERSDSTIHLSGNDNIMGKAVIVHEKVDDYKTQPTGNAGARVACGVIKKKEDKKEEKKK